MDLKKDFWYLILVEQQKETITVQVLTSRMTPLKTIRKTLVSAIFRQFVSCFLDFLTWQEKHNICTLSLDIKLICTHCETGEKYLFLKLVQINLTFFDNVYMYIVYLLEQEAEESVNVIL